MSFFDDIQVQLRRHGHMQVTVSTDEEADDWRRAARAAARRLGRPVETLQHGHIVLTSLKDWPANELEDQVDWASLQRVVSRMPAPHTPRPPLLIAASASRASPRRRHVETQPRMRGRLHARVTIRSTPRQIGAQTGPRTDHHRVRQLR